MDNETKKTGFFGDYFNWLGGKAHLPLIKKWKRFWVLLFLSFLIVGGANSQANPERFITQFLSFIIWSLIYYAWQKYTANKKKVDINEIPTNYVALVIVFLLFAVISYVSFMFIPTQ